MLGASISRVFHMYNAWDKCKSRVPSVMLGTNISLTHTAQYLPSVLPSYVGQV